MTVWVPNASLHGKAVQGQMFASVYGRTEPQKDSKFRRLLAFFTNCYTWLAISEGQIVH